MAVQPPRLEPAQCADFNRLLDAALDLPPHQRAAWLEALDPRFAALKPELQEVLDAASRVETNAFMATLPKLRAQAAAADRCDSSGNPGDIVGPYRLLRTLGGGGMAFVWLAERIDGFVKRPVALKLPHGVWRIAGLAERMAREREILATLDHPHIAQLFDAGITSEGQPYLAIEYVDGQQIDEYCGARRLPLKERLELFMQTANAVAYAHGKLVVHRDLKPANVLVTADGRVKLLDFGIAKLLEQGQVKDSHLTELSGRVLTPDYASPEQILGEPLTIASDIYSLGVLLYELLTETRPYKLKRDSRGALEDAILQTEPARPSDVARIPARKQLRGDLDTIVMKALRKKPQERYATVHAFVEDIERHLTGRPVLARPDSTWYRARKLVARNKLLAAAACSVFAAIVAGAALALWQARVAIAEKTRAEEVKDFITSVFRDADPYGEAGRTLTGIDLLRNARSSINERFDDRPQTRIDLLTTVGSSLTNLGDLAAAEEVLKQALAESNGLYGPRDANTLRARLLLLEVYNARRDVPTLGREVAALMPLLRANVASDPEALIRLLKVQADLAIEEGRYTDAEAPAREAFELARRTLGPKHSLTVIASSLLAETFVIRTQMDPAMLPETARALEFALAAYGGRSAHPHVIHMRQVRGRALAIAGQLPEAVREMEAAIDAADRAFGADSSLAGYGMLSIAPYDRRLGRLRVALERNDRALAILSNSVDRKSGDYAFGLTTRGVTRIAARQPMEALTDLAEAESIYQELFGDTHWDTLTARFNRGVALAYLGRFADANETLSASREAGFEPQSPWWMTHVEGTIARLSGDFDRAIAKQREALKLIPEGFRAPWDEVRVLAELGPALLERGSLDEARTVLMQASELFTKLSIQMHPAQADVLLALGRERISRRAFDDALGFIRQSDAFWREFDPENRFAGEASLYLAQCHHLLGRRSEADEALQRAQRVLALSPLASDRILMSGIAARIRAPDR